MYHSTIVVQCTSSQSYHDTSQRKLSQHLITQAYGCSAERLACPMADLLCAGVSAHWRAWSVARGLPSVCGGSPLPRGWDGDCSACGHTTFGGTQHSRSLLWGSEGGHLGNRGEGDSEEIFDFCYLWGAHHNSGLEEAWAFIHVL